MTMEIEKIGDRVLENVRKERGTEIRVYVTPGKGLLFQNRTGSTIYLKVTSEEATVDAASQFSKHLFASGKLRAVRVYIRKEWW